MKILFLHELDIREHKGGAEQTSLAIVRKGKSLGHTIDYHIGVPDSIPKGYDMLFILTLNADYERMLQFYRGLPGLGIPYVKIDCAFDFIPSRLPPEDGAAPEEWNAVFRPFYESAAAVCFMSPAQRDRYWEYFDRNVIEPSIIIPPPVDTSVFKIDYDVERKENQWIYTGGFKKHKGVDEVLQWADAHRDKKVLMVGGGRYRPMKLPNIEILDQVDTPELVRLYNESRGYVHIPHNFDCAPRTTIEAYLCGCELHLGPKDGNLSFQFDWRDRDGMRAVIADAPASFWRQLGRVMS